MAKKEKIKEPSPSLRCEICNKIKWTNFERSICDKCYQKVLIDIEFLIEENKKLEEKMDKDYARLWKYVDLEQARLNIDKKLYRYAALLPERLVMDPSTYEECKKAALDSIEALINHRISVYQIQMEDLGDAECFVNLKILKNEIIQTREKFPEFKSVLNTDRIDNILSSINQL